MAYMPTLVLEYDLDHIEEADHIAEERNEKNNSIFPVDIVEKAMMCKTNEPIHLDLADIIRVVEFYMEMSGDDEFEEFNLSAPLALMFLSAKETDIHAKGKRRAFLYRPDFPNLFNIMFWNLIIMVYHNAMSAQFGGE